jgi:glutamine synthetase
MPMTSRRAARLAVNQRQPRIFEPPRTADGYRTPVSSYFARHVLDILKLRERLPREAYQSLLATLRTGAALSPEAANAIASVARDWATGHGATHFTHWFQPMTGLTAEKHDSFIDLNVTMPGELKVLERFVGSQLIQSEPDASSFPSGGMRTTFEARGYTAWDPSSPMFLVESENGRTLCVPSVFISYHGDSLDQKTPLLRALEAVDRQTVALLKLLGDVDVRSVGATLGVEQEYFLLDRDDWAQRPDLVLCDRTLLGAASPRGQQFEDHYFGSIPPRVLAFMEELEFELHRLGIPMKTRHNEVAPMQFELAPIFEDANIANDHNALTMDVARKVALRHHLVCLFHEKPFDGLNGSGKHSNWSLVTDRGENLLDPGRTPHQNLRFLTFMAVCLKAVHDHGDAMRASIASANNDLRLGANEAPPAILSVFVGDLMTQIIERIIAGSPSEGTEQFIVDMGVGRLPQLALDYTDRNRTSPFAFTGNRFEFRAVGSSMNCAGPMAVLLGAVADATGRLAARLKAKLDGGARRDDAVLALLREAFTETAAVRFDGNNYSEDWRAEAAQRGLPERRDTPAALGVLRDPARVAFLREQGVYTEAELASRYNIAIERYIKQVTLEAETQLELLRTLVIPAGEKQLAATLGAWSGLAPAGDAKATAAMREAVTAGTRALSGHVERLSATLAEVMGAADELEKLLSSANGGHDEAATARRLADSVRPLMAKAREAADRLEQLVDDELWPLPKYREILFMR